MVPAQSGLEGFTMLMPLSPYLLESCLSHFGFPLILPYSSASWPCPLSVEALSHLCPLSCYVHQLNACLHFRKQLKSNSFRDVFSCPVRFYHVPCYGFVLTSCICISKYMLLFVFIYLGDDLVSICFLN